MAAAKKKRENGCHTKHVSRLAGLVPSAASGWREVVEADAHRFGHAPGTGRRIAALKGIARDNATKAALGLGTKEHGRWGVDGGNRVLAAVGVSVYVGFAALVLAAIVSEAKEADQQEADKHLLDGGRSF